jgi:hypothetical protein
MRELDLERMAIRQQVARALGDDARIDRSGVGSVRVVGLESDVMALPSVLRVSNPLLVMDVTDGLFAQFRFQAGVSSLDAAVPDVLL